jgi:hypothetical protein
MRNTIFGLACCTAAAAVGFAAPAFGQAASPTLRGDIPFEFSRGRNVSVQERPRPEYAPLGIPVGGFTLSPSLTVGPGFTNNVYSLPDKTSDGLVTISPNAELQSNWSRNSLVISGGANIVRYFNQTLKNENGWYARAAGQAELGLNSSLSGVVRIEKLYETRYSPTLNNAVQSAAPYRVNEGRLTLQNSRGRLRLAVSGDAETYRFSNVQVFGGSQITQANRDRDIWSGSGLAEYALSPDVAVFGQVTYQNINYNEDLLPGIPNRSSNTIRGIAGISMDLSALIRGRIGLGYVSRDYDAAIYRNITGLAVEAQIEYFPSQITTVTLNVQRRPDDASILGASGYISTSASLRVDHELLRNLILNAQVAYENGNYKGISSETNVFRVSGGARYLMSRLVSLRGSLAYGQRHNEGVSTGPEFDETRGQIAIIFSK